VAEVPGLIVGIVVIALVLVALARTIRIIPQARAGIVERLGRYSRTLNPGLSILVPFIDNLKPLIDLREQVVSFPPQPVITQDNLVVHIDTVIYFQVTNPKDAMYEIANYIQAIEQLTVTTLRNVIGGMDLERTLTSREEINAALRGVLDEATGKWGIRVNRVELKAIDPPASIQDSMEKQMRADRDKRAAILTAEGFKQSQILSAEGERQAAILRAEGEAQSRILRAEGEAKAIQQVFQAIHDGNPDQKLLAYQYLQMLPQIAQGDANKVWIVPSELGKALEGIGGVLGRVAGAVPDGQVEQPTSGRARLERDRWDAGVDTAGADAGTGLDTGRAEARRGLDFTAGDRGTSTDDAPAASRPTGSSTAGSSATSETSTGATDWPTVESLMAERPAPDPDRPGNRSATDDDDDTRPPRPE
jgi:regulator of protease activity HflC (stomatin/prohibitin superfamily)